MYNKLFTKILDSSIWLEPTDVRIVWITFIAMMDQDGVVALSSVGNVANRARVSEEAAAKALQCLESPDHRNLDQENDGRRIERIPGVGWIVLNAGKYRELATAHTIRTQTRDRVRRHREAGHNIEQCNAPVTHCNESVTPSEAEAEAEAEEKKVPARAKRPAQSFDDWFITLKKEPIYTHIDLDRELRKAEIWITDRPDRKLTRIFFRNWINKIEPPLNTGKPFKAPESESDIKLREGLEASRRLFHGTASS